MSALKRKKYVADYKACEGDVFKLASLYKEIEIHDPEFFEEMKKANAETRLRERLQLILKSEFARSLGEPTDFPGCDRLMFSLDNSDSSIVNDRTLPKLVDLIQDIVGAKLDLRICQGAYRHHDGTYVSEVSFLVRYDSRELYRSITEYLKKHTRQEAVLIVQKSGAASMYSLHEAKQSPGGHSFHIMSLGKWNRVDEQTALRSDGYTQIGDQWFCCDPLGFIKERGE